MNGTIPGIISMMNNEGAKLLREDLMKILALIDFGDYDDKTCREIPKQNIVTMPLVLAHNILKGKYD